jgi:hypothetical protein
MKYYITADLEHPRDIGGDEQNEMLSRVNDTLWQMGFVGSVKFAEPPKAPEGVFGRIYTLLWGFIAAGKNELAIYSTYITNALGHGDAAGVRIGSNTSEPIVGFLLFDHVRDDDVGESIAMVTGTRDERFRHLGKHNLNGGLRFSARRHIPGTKDDGQMKKVVEIHSDRIDMGVEGQEVHFYGKIFHNGRQIL